jgi:hypothetical protein
MNTSPYIELTAFPRFPEEPKGTLDSILKKPPGALEWIDYLELFIFLFFPLFTVFWAWYGHGIWQRYRKYVNPLGLYRIYTMPSLSRKKLE